MCVVVLFFLFLLLPLLLRRRRRSRLRLLLLLRQLWWLEGAWGVLGRRRWCMAERGTRGHRGERGSPSKHVADSLAGSACSPAGGGALPRLHKLP